MDEETIEIDNDILELCGCVESDIVYNYVINLFKTCLQDKRKLSIERVQTFTHGDRALAYIVLSWLDNLDIIEHGTSIRYPWIAHGGSKLKLDKDVIERLKQEKADFTKKLIG